MIKYLIIDIDSVADDTIHNTNLNKTNTSNCTIEILNILKNYYYIIFITTKSEASRSVIRNELIEFIGNKVEFRLIMKPMFMEDTVENVKEYIIQQLYMTTDISIQNSLIICNYRISQLWIKNGYTVLQVL